MLRIKFRAKNIVSVCHDHTRSRDVRCCQAWRGGLRAVYLWSNHSGTHACPYQIWAACLGGWEVFHILLSAFTLSQFPPNMLQFPVPNENLFNYHVTKTGGFAERMERWSQRSYRGPFLNLCSIYRRRAAHIQTDACWDFARSVRPWFCRLCSKVTFSLHFSLRRRQIWGVRLASQKLRHALSFLSPWFKR